MMNMQDKMMAKLHAIADDLSLDFLDQREASNTGVVFVQQDLTTLLVIEYSWQSTYATIYLSKGDALRTRLAEWHHLDYHDGTRLAELLGTVRAHLSGV